MRQLLKGAARGVVGATSRLIARQSLIGSEPVFSPAVFPWLARFEERWPAVRAELDEVLRTHAALPAFHELSPDQKPISTGDNWKVFPFYVFGDPFEPNLARCPETARLLARVPQLRNAMFSILSPHYHVPPHCGPTNGIIRIHLGLIVPGGVESCRIRVADRVFGWEEGKCVVFDDYFEHEVWNDSDKVRVVLFFDVDRPLRPLGRLVNRCLLAGIRRSAYVKDLKRNASEWERRYQAAR
jgi:beta-hydroxylase